MIITEYNKLSIGDNVRLKSRNSCNTNKIGRIVYKKGDYVCLEALDGEPNFEMPTTKTPKQTLLVVHYSGITTV